MASYSFIKEEKAGYWGTGRSPPSYLPTTTRFRVVLLPSQGWFSFCKWHLFSQACFPVFMTVYRISLVCVKNLHERQFTMGDTRDLPPPCGVFAPVGSFIVVAVWC